MSHIEEITKDLSLRVQQAVPNPQSGRVQPLTEQALQRRLDRFYQDAGAVRAKEKLGIIGWARVMMGLRNRLLRAGYPPAMVSPLIRSTLFQAARPDLAVPVQGAAASPPPTQAPKSTKPARSSDAALAKAKGLQESGKRQQAVAVLRGVLAREPRNAEALKLHATLQAQMGDGEGALETVQKLVAVDPSNAQSHNFLGSVLLQLGEARRARDSFDEAIRLQPSFAEAHQNRGLTFIPTFELELALAEFDEAARLEPGVAEYHVQRGFSLLEMGRFDEALTANNEALRLQPAMSQPLWNNSLLKLLRGQFAEGWPLFEARRQALVWSWDKHFKDRPEWTGAADLRGSSITLTGEQGLGDVIHFSRYAKLVSERGARVTLYVDEALVPVLGDLDGVDAVLAYGQTAPAPTDWWAPLMSLPRILGTTEATIPSPGPYLRPDPAKVQLWTEKLGARRKPRVGLVWSGNPAHPKDLFRIIPLETLVKQLPSGYDYFGLQKDLRQVDREWLSGSGIRFMGPELADFADTAAVCSLMDVVLSVDTSVAHLAAATGRPTWVLLPAVPDWRWMLDREDSPWYETVRLFRQGADRKWEPVLDRAFHEMKAKFA